MNNSGATVQSARAHDALLVVCQDNALRQLVIMEASAGAHMMLGYASDKLTGTDFRDYLGASYGETLSELIEFTENGQDFSEAVARMNQVVMHGSGDVRIQAVLKVVRLATPDGRAWFSVLLQPKDHKSEVQRLLEIVHSNLEGVRQNDEITGLPNQYSLKQFIPTIANYIGSHGLQCCFALARIDRHEKNIETYGEQASMTILRHVASCCERTFRSDDIVAVLDNQMLGILLFNITEEAARIVLSRLRGFVASQHMNFGGRADFSNNVSIVFSMLHEQTSQQIIDVTQRRLEAVDKETRSGLIMLSPEDSNEAL